MLYYHKWLYKQRSKIMASKFNLVSQFLKDISFESPNVPELFFKQDKTQAKMEISVDIKPKAAENNLFMVDLILKVHSKLEDGEKSIFLIDTTYSCLVKVEEKDEEAKKRILLVDVPSLLFPFVRDLIIKLTAESGFPPFAMQPLDFEEMYNQKNKPAKK